MNIPKSTDRIKIPFYYHECECGRRLVYTWTAPCSVCQSNNKSQSTIFMGHVMVKVDKEGFLDVKAPLKVR